MKNGLLILLLSLLALATAARAAEEWAEKDGVVREIDLANRTAIISGFRYYFGTSFGYQTPEIELLLYPRGSFEMLQVGMKVQFHYTPRKPYRRILRLRQLPDDAWRDNDELPDAIPITGNKGT
ncbi:MAG: hypothetical protein ACPHE0_08940 [Pseudomonadales bacterium]|jgi:hypothetical protein